MALEFQRRVVAAVRAALPHHEVDGRPRTPAWLNRPGSAECRGVWPLVERIYAELTGRVLPDEMPARERRSLDAVIVDAAGVHRVLEVDELQHFNAFRAVTLELYAPGAATGFSQAEWSARCLAKTRLERGGFAKPRPPLFPGEDGRHRQRAFRDALADLVPVQHGWGATVRMGWFELPAGATPDEDAATLSALLVAKGVQP